MADFLLLELGGFALVLRPVPRSTVQLHASNQRWETTALSAQRKKPTWLSRQSEGRLVRQAEGGSSPLSTQKEGMIHLLSRGRSGPLGSKRYDLLGTRRRRSVSLGGWQRKWFSRRPMLHFLKSVATSHPMMAAAGTTMMAIWKSLHLQSHSSASLFLFQT